MQFNLLEKKSTYLLSSGQYFLDDFDNKKIELKIAKNSNVELLCKKICDLDNISCYLEDGSNVKLLLLAQSNSANFEFLAYLKKNSQLNCFVADFSCNNSNIKASIFLLDDNASCNWNLSSLGINEDNKKIDVSIYHKFSNTFSLINNYGVSRNQSKIQFSGVSHIEKGSYESKAHQNAKIMVFDNESNGIAKPILKIDENDIEASHAAVVGKISDDQLFYLMSRGLTINQSRQLITYGYLKPILNGFDDQTKIEINNLIEERI